MYSKITVRDKVIVMPVVARGRFVWLSKHEPTLMSVTAEHHLAARLTALDPQQSAERSKHRPVS